ncbi:MAG: transporter [Bacteroidota bacterium]|nr:transporter [Bacteroidota bacterium]
MKRILLPLCLFLLPSFLHAQQWSPDRPGRSVAPSTVPAGQLSLEAGLRWERAEFSPVIPESFADPGVIYSHDIFVLPAGLVRVGLGDHFELRLSSSYRRWQWEYDPNYLDGDNVDDPVIAKTDAGLQFLTVGIKSALLPEHGILPAVAMIAALGVPRTGSGGFQVQYLAPDFALAFQRALSPRVGLTCNVGTRWDGYVVTPIGYYSAAVTAQLHARLAAFVEFYGDLPGHAPPVHALDAGLSWAAGEDLHIDAAFAYGLNSPGEEDDDPDLSNMIATDLAVEIGASWRLVLWE